MIISFSRLGRYGRLGNQLFQIASTMGLAETYGAQAVFPEWQYEEYFETPIPHGERQLTRVTEKHFHHHDWELSGDCDILGYLQSEKYFGSTRLKLKQEFVEACKAKYPALWERETICIQVRRGDYVGNPNYYQLPATFYMDALLAHFPNWRECNLLFTSDDIEYCRTHFECLPNATFSDKNNEIQDLALGSACDHFIISNSTFGWWQAWLGEKPHTKVVHSGYLGAGNLAQIDARDYRPERWIRHQKDRYVLPLQDVTFTIPVCFDHDDRRKNLNLSLCLLQQAFDSNYMVCEQGGETFRYIQQFATYARMNLPNFHRTRMLNWMAEVAETPYVVNWDADVIIPPAQIYMAVEKLRAGADVVYPYDGRFARMPREPWFKELEKSLDIGIVGATMFENRMEGHMSVGGAVMFNRKSFVDGGMENERMIAYGPEDFEREYRFRMLGFDIQRVGGSLFHMAHWVGPNSSKTQNPYYRDNWAEWERVQKMSKPQLRAYVDTWPWRHPYTPHYYDRIQVGAARSAKIVMEALYFQEGSVIDVGCGLGEWNNDNPNYYGVDHGVRVKDLLIPPSHYTDHDLTAGPLEMDRKFDLCLCLEVAEHLAEEYAETLVESLCSLSDRVLFSAAIPLQGGVGHVNEQFQSYWAAFFEQQGFGAAKRQPAIRDCEEVELWYRQNIVLYERGAKGKVVDFVLPEYYLQIVQNLHNRLKDLGR